jgi:hypothetical protein
MDKVRKGNILYLLYLNPFISGVGLMRVYVFQPKVIHAGPDVEKEITAKSTSKSKETKQEPLSFYKVAIMNIKSKRRSNV